MKEIIELAYAHDVVQRVVEYMTEHDPTWKIPDGFFPNKFQVNGNLSTAEA